MTDLDRLHARLRAAGSPPSFAHVFDPLNIAARRHDIHLIGRQHLRDGFLTWRRTRRRRTTNKVLTVRSDARVSGRARCHAAH